MALNFISVKRSLFHLEEDLYLLLKEKSILNLYATNTSLCLWWIFFLWHLFDICLHPFVWADRKWTRKSPLLILSKLYFVCNETYYQEIATVFHSVSHADKPTTPIYSSANFTQCYCNLHSQGLTVTFLTLKTVKFSAFWLMWLSGQTSNLSKAFIFD